METSPEASSKIPNADFIRLFAIAVVAAGLGAFLFSIILHFILDMGPFGSAFYASCLGFAFTIIPNLFRLMKLYKKIGDGKPPQGDEIFIEGCKHGFWVYAVTTGAFLAGCVILIGLPLLMGAVMFFPALAPISVVCGIFTVSAYARLGITTGNRKAGDGNDQ